MSPAGGLHLIKQPSLKGTGAQGVPPGTREYPSCCHRVRGLKPPEAHPAPNNLRTPSEGARADVVATAGGGVGNRVGQGRGAVQERASGVVKLCTLVKVPGRQTVTRAIWCENIAGPAREGTGTVGAASGIPTAPGGERAASRFDAVRWQLRRTLVSGMMSRTPAPDPWIARSAAAAAVDRGALPIAPTRVPGTSRCSDSTTLLTRRRWLCSISFSQSDRQRSDAAFDVHSECAFPADGPRVGPILRGGGPRNVDLNEKRSAGLCAAVPGTRYLALHCRLSAYSRAHGYGLCDDVGTNSGRIWLEPL